MGQLSAAVHTADDEPDEDPPRTEEGDDAVQQMVGTVTLNVGMGDLRGRTSESVCFYTDSTNTLLYKTPSCQKITWANRNFMRGCFTRQLAGYIDFCFGMYIALA